MQIWKKYFLKEILKVFFFFLVSFFFLYALLDFSTHMDDFFKERSFQITDLFTFYGYHFIKRVAFLFPLALVIATIKVLTTFNSRREWLALQVAGLKTKTLLKPFFYVATASLLFCAVNFEFFLPKALTEIDAFHAAHFKSSHRAKRQELIHLLTLGDNSKLIYQSYDAEKDALLDVLWIRSFQDIWRMKYLNADPTKPVGQYVDHITYDKGLLQKADSYDEFTFTDLKWRPSMVGAGFVPFENRSTSELFHLAFKNQDSTPFEIPKMTTHFYFKLAMPLLALLVVIAVAPFCIRYNRLSTPFLNYAFSLFGFLGFYMIMDSMVILGEYRVIPPLVAIATPLLITGTFFTWTFRKI